MAYFTIQKGAKKIHPLPPQKFAEGRKVRTLSADLPDERLTAEIFLMLSCCIRLNQCVCLML